MRRNVPRSVFQRAFPDNSSYINLYERATVFEPIIILLLARYCYHFPKQTNKLHLTLLQSFTEQYVKDSYSEQLFYGLRPYFEKGASRKNIFRILYFVHKYFYGAPTEEKNLKLIITFYVCLLLLYRRYPLMCWVYGRHMDRFHQTWDFTKENAVEDFVEFFTSLILFVNTEVGGIGTPMDEYVALFTQTKDIHYFIDDCLKHLWNTYEQETVSKNRSREELAIKELIFSFRAQ